MYVFADFRINFLFVLISFYMFVRQIFKDLNLIRFIILAKRHDEEVILFGGHKRMFDGLEGVGKTLNATNDAVLLACDKDEKMRFEYYLKKPFENELKDDLYYKVLTDSYEFYKNNPDKIPHLMSNYKITYDGKENFDFDMNYLDQKKRLAEGFVMSLTELADLFPNSWSKMPKDEKKDPHSVIKKNETLSKSRQWFDLTIVSDEQRMGEVFIGFRSVTGLGRSLIDRKQVLVPKFLNFFTGLIYKTIMRKKEKNTKFFSKLYFFLSGVSGSIGFYKFVYIDREVLTSKGICEKQFFYVPCNFLFDYDSRGQILNYPLYKDKPE